MRSWVAQVRKGLVEFCVLAALRDGEAYGYQLLQRLAQTDCLAFSESTVYPVLARLAEGGMVKVRVGPSPSGPPRRYYQLTAEGRARLAGMNDYWSTVCNAIEELQQEGGSLK